MLNIFQNTASNQAEFLYDDFSKDFKELCCLKLAEGE